MSGIPTLSGAPNSIPAPSELPESFVFLPPGLRVEPSEVPARVGRRAGDELGPEQEELVRARRTDGPHPAPDDPRRPCGSADDRPSGLKATAITLSSWSSVGPIGLPVSVSQSRAVLSSLPSARMRPSGLKATDRTGPSVAHRLPDRLAGSRRPDPDGPVDAPGQEPPPVGAPGHGEDFLVMPQGHPGLDPGAPHRAPEPSRRCSRPASAFDRESRPSPAPDSPDPPRSW